MACTYTLQDKDFGIIEVLETSRSRGISVRIFENGKVRVATRRGTHVQDITAFIDQNRSDILRMKEKLSKQNKNRTQTFDLNTTILTHDHTISFSPTTTDGKVHIRSCENGDVTLSYPKTMEADNPNLQAVFRKAIDQIMKKEAETYLPQRVSTLANANGLKYDHLDLRNMKSRWGSCSSAGRICLNIQLMRLPDHLIDMVILHELTHTVHMNHGPKFWAMLNDLCGGNIKALEKEIKTYRTTY